MFDYDKPDMKHSEHVHLIKKAITKKGGVWADLGSGDGAFTLALRDLAGPDVEIFSIDKDRDRLKRQKEAFEKQFPISNIHYHVKDFTVPLELPLLDGVIMANSLHYIKDHIGFLISLRKDMKPGAKLVLIEYSLDRGQPPWVPYPLSFNTFEKEAKKAGFTKTELLERIPSSYWDEMYSSQAIS